MTKKQLDATEGSAPATPELRKQWVQVGAYNLFGVDGEKIAAGSICEVTHATAAHFDKLDKLKILTASDAAARIEAAAEKASAAALKAEALQKYREAEAVGDAE